MTDRQRDERPWKRICLDHTLSSEVFSSQSEHYKAVKTTAEPCSQDVHISDQRLSSLVRDDQDERRDENHDEHCQNLRPRCNGGAYQTMERIYAGSSPFHQHQMKPSIALSTREVHCITHSIGRLEASSMCAPSSI
jgi:hypothetical protein